MTPPERESLASQALFADLTHTPQGALSCPCRAIHLVSPNPNKAIRGCGPLSTPGFFDRLRGRHGRDAPCCFFFAYAVIL